MSRVRSAFGAVAVIAALTVPTPASADPTPTPAPAPAPLPGGTWTSLTPHRVVDTRIGLGAPTGPTRAVSVDPTSAGVPDAGVAAVAATVTVVGPATSGYLYRYSAERAGASISALTVLSFAAGRNTAGLVIAPVDGSAASASAFVLRSSTPVTLVVDVLGYFTTADSAASSGRYVAVSPSRVLDTRRTGVAVCSRCTASVRVVGTGLLPAGAVAAALVNTTAVGPAGSGYLTTYGDGARPGTSTVVYAPAQTVANRSIVPIGPDGTIHVYNGGRATHVLVDVSGYFTSGTQPGAYYVPVSGGRAVDTRFPWSSYSTDGRITGLTTVEAAGNSLPPLPFLSAANRPVAAVATLTAARPTGGWAVIFADGTHRPTVSDLDTTTGVDESALVVPSFGSDGRFGLYSSAPSDYVLDVFGYFALPAVTPPHGAWAYGDDDYLQAAQSPPAYSSRTPVALFDSASTRWVAADTHYRYEMHTDGTLDRIVVSPRAAQRIDRLFAGATAMATLNDGGVALRSDGTVWAWGTNDALGRPGVTVAHYPIQVPGIAHAVAVAAGEDQAYAVLNDGTVLAWGANTQGELGDGTTTTHASPEVVPGVTGVAKIVRTQLSTYAVHTDGTLSQWGYWTGSTQQLTPTSLPLPCNAAEVASSGADFVLCTDGSVRELEGTGRTQVSVSVPSGIVDIAADPEGVFPVLLRVDGTVWRVDDAQTYRPIAGIAQISGISGSRIVAMWTAN